MVEVLRPTGSRAGERISICNLGAIVNTSEGGGRLAPTLVPPSQTGFTNERRGRSGRVLKFATVALEADKNRRTRRPEASCWSSLRSVLVRRSGEDNRDSAWSLHCNDQGEVRYFTASVGNFDPDRV